MKRTILFVLSGIAVGVAAALYLDSAGPPRVTSAGGEDRGFQSDVRTLGPAERVWAIAHVAEGGDTQRSTVYQLAVQSDETDLREMIEQIGAGPTTATQRFTLSVLFTRYAELDIGGAIDTLGTVREPRLAEAMGLAILEVIGTDEDNIARVAAALPGTDPNVFRVEAITALATSAPSEALQMALLTRDAAFRSHAVRRVARSWARQDPAAALASASLIQNDELKRLLRDVAASEWARVEPETLLTHIVRLTDQTALNELLSTGAIRELTAMFPDRVLDIADDLPAQAALRVTFFALRVWAETDPLAAYARAESLPLGQRRQQALQQIATAYASEEPDAALLWLESFGTPPRDLRQAVLQGIAQKDPDRAVDLVLDDHLPGEQPWNVTSIVMRIAFNNREHMPAIADRILAVEDVAMRDEMLRMMASSWTRSDASAALDWALSNAGALPNQTLSEIARQLAQDDPAAAREYANRMPPGARDTWITTVAAGYAAYDRQGALDWIGQYLGQPAYVPALMGVVRATAQQDPVAAAALLQSVGRLPEGSDSTVGGIVRNWALRDVSSARNWTINLPRGEARDAALSALVERNRSTELPDAELMAAFSTELARQQAVARIIYNIARSDPLEARRLVDEHLSYPAVRQQAERFIDRIGR